MRDLEIRGAGNLLGDEQSGPRRARSASSSTCRCSTRPWPRWRARARARSAASPCASTSTSTPTSPPTTCPTSRPRSTSTGASPARARWPTSRSCARSSRTASAPVPEPLRNLLAAPAGADQARAGRRAQRVLPRRPPRRHADRARLRRRQGAARRRSRERCTSPGGRSSPCACPTDPAERFPAVVRAADVLLRDASHAPWRRRLPRRAPPAPRSSPSPRWPSRPPRRQGPGPLAPDRRGTRSRSATTRGWPPTAAATCSSTASYRRRSTAPTCTSASRPGTPDVMRSRRRSPREGYNHIGDIAYIPARGRPRSSSRWSATTPAPRRRTLRHRVVRRRRPGHAGLALLGQARPARHPQGDVGGDLAGRQARLDARAGNDLIAYRGSDVTAAHAVAGRRADPPRAPAEGRRAAGRDHRRGLLPRAPVRGRRRRAAPDDLLDRPADRHPPPRGRAHDPRRVRGPGGRRRARRRPALDDPAGRRRSRRRPTPSRRCSRSCPARRCACGSTRPGSPPACAPASRVRVTAPLLGRRRPVAGATRRACSAPCATTDAHGRAVLRMALPHAGRYRLRASWRGDRGSVRVRAGSAPRSGRGLG